MMTFSRIGAEKPISLMSGLRQRRTPTTHYRRSNLSKGFFVSARIIKVKTVLDLLHLGDS